MTQLLNEIGPEAYTRSVESTKEDPEELAVKASC